jgi:hypothetical protein
MPRERDYEEEYRRSNEIAWSLGYENAYQRREIRAAGSPEELKEILEPLVQQRAAELDYQSLGMIYADIYESWDNDWDFGDLWEDMEY